MNTFSYNLLNMSISASIVIIGVILLRYGCRKLPKQWTVYLWLLPLFRLLSPYSFSSDVSVFQYTKTMNHQIQHIPNDESIITSQLHQLAKGTEAASGSANYFSFLLNNLHILWGIICIILLIRMIYKYFTLKKILSASVYYKDNIFLNDTIDTAFVFGFIHPHIYLSSALNQDKRNAILLHEQAHIKRFDYLWKAFAYVIVCVYWFNPLIWLAFYLFTLDMEMACDEYATKTLNTQEKADYSELLLALSTKKYGYVPTMPFGEQGVALRIKHLLQEHKQPLWIIIIAFIVICFSAVALLSNPANKKTVSINSSVEELYQLKMPYLGNAPKVRTIVDHLLLPDGLQVDSIQLDNNAYGLQINYAGSSKDKALTEEQLIKNASLLMLLVDNLQQVTYQFESGLPKTYTIHDVLEFYPSDIQGFFAFDVLNDMTLNSRHTEYTLEEFNAYYQMPMMNETLFKELTSYPEDITIDHAEELGFYINTVENDRNRNVEEAFFTNAKEGKDVAMTMVSPTIEGDLIVTRIQHDKHGYRCVQDATRDHLGNPIYYSYAYMHMVAVEHDDLIDVYLTSEADLNQERIDRAKETGEYLNYVFLYQKKK